MRVVIQRVSRAAVSVEGEVVGSINGPGLMILLGIESADAESASADTEWLCGKIARLRIFSDAEGAMNLSVGDVGGSALVVSQFTLHGSTRRGNRPSFINAARPDVATPIYEEFIASLTRHLGREVATGIFGADMQIDMVADGPVTIIIDSKIRE